MPYKANEARRHKIPRAHYKVANWPEYDGALQRRGGLTVWVAVLHGSVGRAHSPLPRSGSCDADGLRASQLQHAVEGVDGNLHLGRPTLIRA